MSNEYKQGYKDGFDAGISWYKHYMEEESKKNLQISPPAVRINPIDYNIGCKVCGVTGVRNQVCYIHNCPSRAYATNIVTGTSEDF